MRRNRRSLLLIGVAAAVLVATAGCAPASGPSIALDEDTVIVDVRSPAEYAGGHLDGAVNLDLQSAAFSADVAALDDTVDYVVYCQSGNRSAQAASVMAAAGLDVTDAGGISAAATATGLEIVQ